jgi:hypothetical protein
MEVAFSLILLGMCLKNKSGSISSTSKISYPIFENVSVVEKELLQVRTSENVVDKRQFATVMAKCSSLRNSTLFFKPILVENRGDLPHHSEAAHPFNYPFIRACSE